MKKRTQESDGKDMFGKKQNDNDVPKLCVFCEKAALLADGDTVLCSKKGIVACDHTCRAFSYDPLKHVPKPKPAIPLLDEDSLVL